MVSEGVTDGVMSACAEFTQNAWKKDLCVNCQRPRAEHETVDKKVEKLANAHKKVQNGTVSAPVQTGDAGNDSPKPAKRNSLMTKSWTGQVDEKHDDSEDDQWNAMCLPDPEQPDKRLDEPDSAITTCKSRGDTDRKHIQEHSYEDIDGEELKQGQSSKVINMTKEKTVTVIPVGDERLASKSDNLSKGIPKQPINPEDRLGSLINDGSKFPPDRDAKSRSRSSSREKSPASKPKLFEKPVIADIVKSVDKIKMQRHSESDITKPTGNISPRSRKKLKKGQRSISFHDNEATVIGEDGGLDNLYSDHEEDFDEGVNETNEIMNFTEDEKEWALQALKNTIWNTEHINAERDKPEIKSSKEYEDLEMESLWKPDRFANVRDCDPFPDSATQSFGTFPLRTKSEKTAVDNMFSCNRLSTLSESLENMLEESNDDKYDAVLKFLGADKIDFSSSPKHKNAVKGDLNVSDCSDPSYDDPWEGKFGFESESEMNLLDEIKGEIDLDSSTAGFALVDLLNDVLSKYTTGTSSESDSIKNLDALEDDVKTEKGDKSDKKDGKEKSAELEAKMVTLAASLRKRRSKGRAPRPPSCPPQPPQEVTNSPEKQRELRAAQSKEPTFKMVPIGKPIGGNPLSQSAPASSNIKPDISVSTGSNNSSENMEGYKIKNEKEKQPKKSGGGIGGFFSRILRRGRDSETDLSVSSETLVSNSESQSDGPSDSESQSDKGSNFDRQGSGRGDKIAKRDKQSSKSSPLMKMKVLPTLPVSPRPLDKPPQADAKKDIEKDEKNITSQHSSPKVESKSKENVKTEKSDKNASQKNNTSRPDLPIAQLSPSKSSDKDLATSPKFKEAPPLPLHPPREGIDTNCGPPKPRARGNSDGGLPRSRPRTRDSIDGRQRDMPNAPPPKPPVALKPRPPAGHTKSMDISDNANKNQQRFTSTNSLDDSTKNAEDSPKNPDPKMLRKRAKSPKRFAAPVAPARTSMPNILSDSTTSLTSNTSESSIQNEHKSDQPKGLAFAKELELKLQKDQSSSAPEGRKLSAPPPLPTTAPKIDVVEKSKSLPAEHRKTGSKDKDIPKPAQKDSERAKSTSKDDLHTSPPPNTDKATLNPVESDAQQQLSQEPVVPPAEMPVHTEKIELPKPAGHSRKSFLGKLNRKNKPPAPPSVKRTKSITETHVLAEHHGKKIDLKDISGPVLITEMSSNKVVNRRNTISLGDDNSFLSGGSTSSGSTSGEKSDISPRGSMENMYEFIKSEAPTPPQGDKKNLYDPVVENNVVGLRPPSMSGSEGYLEPIKSNTGVGPVMEPACTTNMAESTTSMGSMTTSMVTMVNNMADVSKSGMDSFQSSDNHNVNQSGQEDLDISPERRELLASQPIYEEITNGYGKFGSRQAARNQLGEDSENVPEEFYGVHDPSQHTDPIPATTSSLTAKHSVSSDSELSSANSSLSRPRPIPRKRPRHVGSGFEQYVAMNRPSVAVFLNEEQLREMLSKLTAMNLTTLRDIYTQHEKCFTKESLHLGSVGPLKWQDFDIYGKPLHTSEKCIVYNAKMRTTMSPCQVMLLHSRPEITCANHPSLLKPTCIFTDPVPFSYLTDAFINTSQILETTVSQANANMAKCYIVVGLFDISESLNTHLTCLQTICENQKDFLRKVLFFVLQLLSAISHCLEQGHSLSEADFHDLYLISNPYCLGETVSFLPQVRSPEDQQIDRVCLFLEKFLLDMSARCDASCVLDDSAFFTYAGVQRVIELLESGVTECLPIVRSYTEFLLWGPGETDSDFLDDRQSNLEPKLSMWLEKERALLIHDFAGRIQHGARCNIKDFYKMKFLLKASSGSLAECIRCHAASPS